MNNFPDTARFRFFEIVYLITDCEDTPQRGQVIGILFKPGAVLYQVQWGIRLENYCYAEELTTDNPKVFSP